MPKKELTLDQIIINNTYKWAAKNGYKGYIKEKNISKSKRVLEIENFLKNINNFDNRQSQIAELFSIVLDEPINISSTDFFKPFTMIVPIEKIVDSHNYPLNKPTLIVFGQHGITFDGNLGNSLTTKLEFIRPATEKEIKEFIANIKL